LSTPVLIHDTGALLSKETLESIVEQPNAPTSAQVNVGDLPSLIYITSFEADDIYVINTGSDSVSVFDPHTNTVVKNIPVEQEPTFIRRVDNALYVANSGSDSVSVIDPKTNNVTKNIATDI
jgi:YVTN family beta-propeller protein